MAIASTGQAASDDGLPHRIHLRGPWQAVWCDAGGQPIGDPIRLKHPDGWPEFISGKSGRMQLRRTFHTPTNLEPHEAVFVMLTGVRGQGEVQLNDTPLGRFEARQIACEFALPLPLQFSNVLTIDVTFPESTSESPDAGLFGPVALEIRAMLNENHASAKRR